MALAFVFFLFSNLFLPACPAHATVTTSEEVESQGEHELAAEQDADFDEPEVEITPSKNTTVVEFSIPAADSMLSQGAADTVEITATMTYGSTVTREVSQVFPLSDFVDTSVSMDFGTYGKFNVDIRFIKNSDTVYNLNDVAVGVTADVYNLAPMCGTLPVTFFSLNLWGDQSIRSTGPVIAVFERANSYDWSNLPAARDDLYGMYALPYLTEDEIRYQPANGSNILFRERISIVADYVRDLMELDSTSTINLYCVDYYTTLIQSVIYANKIPQDQYSITVISDGSFTYNQFSKNYDSANPSAQHQKLVETWNNAKNSAYETGTPDATMLDWNASGQYFWAAVDSEPNAELWVARKDLIKSEADGNAFGLSVQSSDKVVQISIANLLTTNIQSSEVATQEFKELYNFNDSYFSAAEENNKDVMMFLGTRVDLEQGFSDYARFTMSYYGDAYEYYYKGHPATPTDLWPNKQEQLGALGITDVDSSVAAELILFFNPEIFLSGYNSSTYASVPDGKAKGMFEMSKEQGLSKPEYRNMDFWATRVTDSSPSDIRGLCTQGHSNYLVEFSDDLISSEGYEIAIWDATDSTITYYASDGDTSWVEVGSSEGVSEQTSIESGDYVIMSSLRNGAVLDVENGSSSDGANVQLYTYNGTDAQKWHIDVDESGHATIQNIGSGKFLDAAWGQSSNGTNVWQYAENESASQQWRILTNDDGTRRIVSSLGNGPVVDVAGGSKANGTNIQLWSSNFTASQSFVFLPLDPEISTDGQADVADGYYQISSSVNPSYCLDVTDWSKSNGARIQLWESTGADNQIFKITKRESGFYTISSAWSNKGLDVTNGNIMPGTPIQQWGEGEGVQEWKILDQTGGMYAFQNVATGLVIDLDNAIAQNGRAINGYSSNGTNAQNWLLTLVGEPGMSFDEWAESERDVLPDGIYLIQSRVGQAQVLDVANGALGNGGNVQLFNWNGTPAQLWRVTHDDKGYVTFTNINSGKVLDVAAGIASAGTNVQQYESNNSLSQKWVALRTETGQIEVVSALSKSLCLDVSGGSGVPRANIQIYTRNGTDAQRFTFFQMIE